MHRAFVVVVGLGGVGSHAAAMLLRSGVGKLRLIDFDQVRVMRRDVLQGGSDLLSSAITLISLLRALQSDWMI